MTSSEAGAVDESADQAGAAEPGAVDERAEAGAADDALFDDAADGLPAPRRLIRPLTLIAALAGAPTIWYVVFWVIYLGAEWVCTETPPSDVVLGLDWLSLAVLGITVAATAITAISTWWVAEQVGPAVRPIALVLGGTFVASILIVGLPALFLEPC